MRKTLVTHAGDLIQIVKVSGLKSALASDVDRDALVRSRNDFLRQIADENIRVYSYQLHESVPQQAFTPCSNKRVNQICKTWSEHLIDRELMQSAYYVAFVVEPFRNDTEKFAHKVKSGFSKQKAKQNTESLRADQEKQLDGIVRDFAQFHSDYGVQPLSLYEDGGRSILCASRIFVSIA